MESQLRRYTELPYVIDYLCTQELVLLSPASWDDRNDSFYIEEYARMNNIRSVYALCLADCPETYHHWRVFSQGSGGACIQFDREKFLAAISKIRELRAEKVKYATIDELRRSKPVSNDLPFLKRYAYQNENEFRIFYASTAKGSQTYRISVPLDCVDRVILSPWLPKEVAKRIKTTINSIPGCSKVKIYHSTLVENDNWKKLANGHA